MAKIGGHERGHGRIEVALPAYDADIDKLGHVLARGMVQDASPQRRRGLTRTPELHKRDRRTAEHSATARLCPGRLDPEPGPPRARTRAAALDVGASDRDVVEIRRAAGKVD